MCRFLFGNNSPPIDEFAGRTSAVSATDNDDEVILTCPGAGIADRWRVICRCPLGHRRGALVIISPHYDDGVFGCADLIRHHPGGCLVTVFGALPNEAISTDWDRDAGFADARDAVAARREEDAVAAARLSAQAMWLGFSDSQYSRRPAAAAIASVVSDLISAVSATTVVFPLGVVHSDHVLAHDSVLRLVTTMERSIDWFLYEDAIYRRHEAVVPQRLRGLRAARFILKPIVWPGVCSESKRPAVYCYRSQLVALSRRGRSGFLDVFRLEHYWRLRPASIARSRAQCSSL